MYDVAARLDPDSYLELATVTYREMVAAGITSVGEFHYLHHQPDGTPYDEPERDGSRADRGGDASRDCGSRCSTPATSARGFGEPPQGVQVRYDDGSADRLGGARRRSPAGRDVRIGAAIHSIRAVPRDAARRTS